jgi:hypothetical protein
MDPPSGFSNRVHLWTKSYAIGNVNNNFDDVSFDEVTPSHWHSKLTETGFGISKLFVSENVENVENS